VVEAPKHGFTKSHAQQRLEAENAAMIVATRTQFLVVTDAVKFHAKVIGLSGVIVASRAVMEPDHEAMMSSSQPSAVVRSVSRRMVMERLRGRTATNKLRVATSRAAHKIAVVTGALGPHAIKNAPTVKVVMVLLARNHVSSQSDILL